MTKMKSTLLVLSALSLNLMACSKNEADRVVADVPKHETRDSLMKIEEGKGDACPEITGKYACTDEGATVARNVEFKQENDSQGRQVFTQSGDTPATDKSLVASAFEQYVMNIEGGIVSDGKVQDKSIGLLGAQVPLKYVVTCSGTVLSLHVVTGNNGSRTTVEKQNDGGLKLESWQSQDDGKVENGHSDCKKI